MLRRLFPLRAGTVLALLLLTTWAAFRVTAAEPTAVPSPVTIAPEPLGLKTGAPLSTRALVLRPPSVKGLRSWTIETRRHRGYISTFAVSPDGKSLATGGLDGIVRVWDVGTGRFVRALVGHDSYVYGLAYSPDGNTLASAGSYDATVRLWDTRTGQPLRVLRHKSYVVHVAWAPDGRTLASAGGESGFVTFWDAPSGRELRILEYGRYVYALAWSPDGKTLAAGGLQVGAQLWDAEEGKSLAKIEQDGGDVYTLAWAPDGKSLATAGKTNSVLWQIDGGKSKALQRLPDSARALAWAPDGKTLAAELPTGAVQLWDVQTNKVLKPIGTSANLLRWLPDGSALVCGSSLALTLWDTSPKLLRTIEVGTLAPLTWRPGKPLVSGVGTAQLSIWETSTCKPLHPLPAFPAGVAGVDWSPGGKTLACACSDGKVRLIEAATGKVDPALEGHKGPVAALAWSPSGKTLASASADKTVRLWTPGSTKPPRVLEGHEDAVNLLAWAPGGATLASGSADGTVRLWSADTGKITRTLRDLPGVASVAWSPNGRSIAAGCNDDRAYVYTLGGKLLHTFELAGSPRSVTGLAWSSDSNILAAGRDNHTMQLWDIKTDKMVHSLPTMAPVTSVVWPHPSATVASATIDGAVRFWDSIPGRLRATLILQNNQVSAVSADGHCLTALGTEPELVYVAQEERAQETLTPKAFVARYRWKNNPSAVKLTGN